MANFAHSKRSWLTNMFFNDSYALKSPKRPYIDVRARKSNDATPVCYTSVPVIIAFLALPGCRWLSRSDGYTRRTFGIWKAMLKQGCFYPAWSSGLSSEWRQVRFHFGYVGPQESSHAAALCLLAPANDLRCQTLQKLWILSCSDDCARLAFLLEQRFSDSDRRSCMPERLSLALLAIRTDVRNLKSDALTGHPFYIAHRSL